MAKNSRLMSIDCLRIIEQRSPALKGTARQVATLILRNPWSILDMTIYDVAKASDVSVPSVTRFCRTVGYQGFRELVQGIAQSLGRLDSREFDTLESADGKEPNLEAMARQIVARQVDALNITLGTLDYQAIEATISALCIAPRVTIVGHGAAYTTVLGLATKLNWAGIPAYPSTPDQFWNQAIFLGSDDLVIGISHQGRTRDTIEALRLAQKFDATTVGITTVANSPLAAVSNISLSVLSPDIVRGGTFVVAYNALMLVADVLALSASDRRYGGHPPNRHDVVDWIETNLRVGPTPPVKNANQRSHSKSSEIPGQPGGNRG